MSTDQVFLTDNDSTLYLSLSCSVSPCSFCISARCMTQSHFQPHLIGCGDVICGITLLHPLAVQLLVGRCCSQGSVPPQGRPAFHTQRIALTHESQVVDKTNLHSTQRWWLSYSHPITLNFMLLVLATCRQVMLLFLTFAPVSACGRCCSSQAANVDQFLHACSCWPLEW